MNPIERSPEEQAELKAERERFQRERPTEEELLASGEYEGPVRHGDVLEFLKTLARLKAIRERKGLSLADVSERSGIDEAMLSRLESGKILNPTLFTLGRYARSIGVSIVLTVEDGEMSASGMISSITHTPGHPDARQVMRPIRSGRLPRHPEDRPPEKDDPRQDEGPQKV